MVVPINFEAATNDLDKIIEVEDEADIDEAVAAATTVMANIDETIAASDATNSEIAVTSKDKRKRSEVWEHFHKVKVKDKKGNMMMMNKCIHYDMPYKVMMGGPTTTLQRHLQACPYFKRPKGKTQDLIRFESCESETISELNSSRGLCVGIQNAQIPLMLKLRKDRRTKILLLLKLGIKVCRIITERYRHLILYKIR
jgi:hypothetical protein